MQPYAIVQVPGSTSNIGPGFDCMGIALALYNRVRIERSASDGARLESPADLMVRTTAEAFFRQTKEEPFAFHWSIEGEVPMSRGLGSSVTLRQGVLQGLNELCRQPLGRKHLFLLGSELEGHPDNASAGVFGGFTCSNANGQCHQFPIGSELKFLLLIPNRELLTEESRGCLPDRLPRKEAVRSLGNACSITAAFATSDYASLDGCFDDSLHQPYRADANKGLYEVINAGTKAGALGGFLSGSGSTIACVALAEGDQLAAIEKAMFSAYQNIGECRTLVVEADNEGAKTLETGGL